MNKKNVLTILGCSSSLALMLATGNPARANQPTVDRAIESQAPTAEEVDRSTSSADSSSDFLAPNGDTWGNLAIDRFGCDCNGCRNLVTASFEDE
jgi:hypothetical protein